MRAPSWRLLLAACSLTMLGLVSARAADDQADLKGNWRFTLVFPFHENELLIIGVKQNDGKPSAEVKNAIPQLRAAKISNFESKDEKVSFTVSFPNSDAHFSGASSRDGKLLGVLHIQGQTIPAELEKTTADIVKQAHLNPSVFQSYFGAQREPDPKKKAKKYEELTKKAPGSPKMAMAYSELLKAAGPADLDERTVRGYVDEWINGAKGYGPDYASEVRTQALKALTGQKKYADLALTLATEADKSLGKDAPLETRAEVTKALASAAKLAGKDLLAREAATRSEKLEAELDADFHKKVPPFQPEVSLGRKDKQSDRVVLLELFTGAQCPPCVAADVAFDALTRTYKPSELITLQYHLHIPGPDPLTNPDSIARQQYYSDLRGTPSTYFNGKAEAGGGGAMPQSKGKYDQYRQIIDKALEGPKQATIDLKVSRSDDEIKIVASAQAEAKKKGKGDQDQAEKKDGRAEGDEKSALKLWLVLVEEEVRYVGGNRLRFHHHVVRSMPGGPEGTALTDGQGKAEVTVKLSDLRKRLEENLSTFAKSGGGFPNPLPEIKLANLSVVAFVQDDRDKSVLHAVLAPVDGESR